MLALRLMRRRLKWALLCAIHLGFDIKMMPGQQVYCCCSY